MPPPGSRHFPASETHGAHERVVAVGGSAAARHLYATSGYREVAVTMSKALSASDT